MIFPKDVFRLNGYNGEIFALSIREIKDCPDAYGMGDDYEIICSLEISSGCYHIFTERYYASIGTLYHFKDELKKCYQHTGGTARYQMLPEDDLSFTVTMKSSRKSIVRGTYQEYPEAQNILHFEFETETDFFLKLIQDIEQIEGIFHGEYTENKII